MCLFLRRKSEGIESPRLGEVDRIPAILAWEKSMEMWVCHFVESVPLFGVPFKGKPKGNNTQFLGGGGLPKKLFGGSKVKVSRGTPGGLPATFLENKHTQFTIPPPPPNPRKTRGTLELLDIFHGTRDMVCLEHRLPRTRPTVLVGGGSLRHGQRLGGVYHVGRF